jgi:hypothetical protein
VKLSLLWVKTKDSRSSDLVCKILGEKCSHFAVAVHFDRGNTIVWHSTPGGVQWIDYLDYQKSIVIVAKREYDCIPQSEYFYASLCSKLLKFEGYDYLAAAGLGLKKICKSVGINLKSNVLNCKSLAVCTEIYKCVSDAYQSVTGSALLQIEAESSFLTPWELYIATHKAESDCKVLKI